MTPPQFYRKTSLSSLSLLYIAKLPNVFLLIRPVLRCTIAA